MQTQTHELFLSHGRTDTDNTAFQLSISASVCARWVSWVWHIPIAAAYVRIQFENRFTRVSTHIWLLLLASPQFVLYMCGVDIHCVRFQFFRSQFSVSSRWQSAARSLSFVWMKLRQTFFRSYSLTHTHTHTHKYTLQNRNNTKNFSVYICVYEFLCANSDFIAQISRKKALSFELNVEIKLYNFGDDVKCTVKNRWHYCRNTKQPPVLTEFLQIKHQLRSFEWDKRPKINVRRNTVALLVIY